MLAGLHANGFVIQNEAVHREPHARIAQRRRLVVGGWRGIDDFPIVGGEDLALLIG
jgi:hypothetical protein